MIARVQVWQIQVWQIQVWPGVGPAGLKAQVPGRDRQAPAGRHRVARVGREVQDTGFQLRGVDENRPGVVREFQDHRDVFTEYAAHQASHAFDQRIRRNDRGGEVLPPREGQQALGQARPAGRRRQTVGDQSPDPCVVLCQRRQAFQVQRDDGEQVVEIVRDTAGQIADRLHPLRLAQLLLDPQPLGYLHPHRDDAAVAGAVFPDFEHASVGAMAEDACAVGQGVRLDRVGNEGFQVLSFRYEHQPTGRGEPQGVLVPHPNRDFVADGMAMIETPFIEQ